MKGNKMNTDSTIEKIEKALNQLPTNADMAEIRDRVMQLEQRPSVKGLDSGIITRASKRFETVNGHEVKYFARDEMLAKSYHSTVEDFQLGSWVRDNVLGTKAASSTAVVPTGVSSQIIDKVRARTAVIDAGAGSIIIGGPTNVARLLTDPTVHEHTEAAADVTESDITFEALGLNPKTLICTIPLTMEVVADSPNLDDLLNTALAGAFGAKIDALAIALILADGDIPTSSAGQSCATWAGAVAAITQALGLNQALPAAMIGNTADFMARSSQLASTAGNWLGAPPVLAAMLDLYSTGITAGSAIFGNFAEALAIALRQELTVEVVRFGKPGSGSHLLVAHMRAAPVVLQPGKLFIQKTTVA